MDGKIKEICVRLNKIEDDIKDLRSENKAIHKLDKTLVKLDTTMGRILEDINKLNQKVDKLEKQDASRYNHIIKTITAAVITGIVSFIVGGWLK